MKLKDFIEKLSKYDQDLEVLIYTEDRYEDYCTFVSPLFDKETEDYWDSNVEAINDTLHIGG